MSTWMPQRLQKLNPGVSGARVKAVCVSYFRWDFRRRGIDLKPGQGEDSGVHGVLILNGEVDGGFDPRREGVVLTLVKKP